MSETVGGFGGILDPTTGKYTNAPDDKNAAAMGRWVGKNTQTTMSMIASQRESLKGGIMCWVYNISPIFAHSRLLDGFGTYLIPTAPKVGALIFDKKTGNTRRATTEDIAGEYRLSAPLFFNNSYVRTSQSLIEGKRMPYVEYGQDLAEDLVGCSDKYPLNLTSEKDEYSKNLKNWGVFITYGIPFEELKKTEQNELLNKALAVHAERCIEKVNRGDMLYSNYKMKGKGGPLKIHRACAEWLRQNVDPAHAEREWVTQQADMNTMTGKIECPFCSTKIKATVAKCPVCQEIVDAERYEKLARRNKKADKADKVTE
jgi:hypothetical protein